MTPEEEEQAYWTAAYAASAGVPGGPAAVAAAQGIKEGLEELGIDLPAAGGSLHFDACRAWRTDLSTTPTWTPDGQYLVTNPWGENFTSILSAHGIEPTDDQKLSLWLAQAPGIRSQLLASPPQPCGITSIEGIPVYEGPFLPGTALDPSRALFDAHNGAQNGQAFSDRPDLASNRQRATPGHATAAIAAIAIGAAAVAGFWYLHKLRA